MDEKKLQKRYGLPTAIAMVVGIVIGSGIFFKTEAVLGVTNGDALIGVLALIIMGVVLLICAYGFSILSGKYEKVNGLVDYAEVTCGGKYAYYLGWFMTFVYTPAITGALAWVTAMYFGKVMGWALNSGEVLAVAGFIICGDVFINAFAPKLAGKFQVSGTVIKLIPLVLMAVVGIVKGLSSGQIAANFELAAGTSGAGGLTAAVVALAFAFEGWILATSINAELKDAKKNLPRALIFGSIIIVVVYITYYLGVCGAITIPELMEKSSLAAFVNTFGNAWGTLLSVFIVISCLCTTHGLMMACGRNMYGIASRGHGPKPEIFSAIDAGSNMPVNSMLLGALMSCAWMVYYFMANVSGFFGVFSFDSSELPIITLYGMYIPVFIKMFKMKDLNTWQGKIIPALAIICCLFLCGCAVYSHGFVKFWAAKEAGTFAFPVLFFLIVSAVVMLCGIPFYRGSKEPEKIK